MKRLKPGDGIVYYSPRAEFGEGEPVQAFTAIGEIAAGEAYPPTRAAAFNPCAATSSGIARRADAPIRPLLDALDLTRGKTNWGVLFRRGTDRDSSRPISSASPTPWAGAPERCRSVSFEAGGGEPREAMGAMASPGRRCAGKRPR